MATLPPPVASISEISKELERIEESAKYSSQCQFEQAKFWRGVNLAIGAPASALAALAGATALANTGGRVAAGVIALAAAGLGAIATSLNAAQRVEQAQAAGNLYLALQSDARVARLVDLDSATHDKARTALADLRQRQDDVNQGSALPSFYAYHRAKRNINKSRQKYAVDDD